MVRRPPTGNGVIDIAVVSYNTDLYVYRLLASLGRVLPRASVGTVHVWDNASTDETTTVLEAFSRTDRRIRAYQSPVNVQHGPALDSLLRHHCTAEWVLILDSDCEVTRDFVPHLPLGSVPPPAFIGQIHPQMPHLYAYLAHVLIHRPTYLTLPRFLDDGAPGREYFRAVQTRRLPWTRFRWTDFVTHTGQASIRALWTRGERGHPLYRFAAAQIQDTPTPITRTDQEAQLRARMGDWLAHHRATEGAPSARATERAIPPAPVPAARRVRLPAWPSTIASPTTMLAVRRARKIGLVHPIAEMQRLFEIVRRLRPRHVMEIGTAYGGSLYLWTRAAARHARIISVDLPPWELDDPWEPRRVAEFKGLARRAQHLDLIRADSHAASTRQAVLTALGSASLDFLFLDGDHSPEGVRQDIAHYSGLLRPGGLMARPGDITTATSHGAGIVLVWK